MVSSARLSIPSWMQLVVSSTTIPEPLSALLMTKEVSEASSFSAVLSFLDKLWENLMGCSSVIPVYTRCRQDSTTTEALGGTHVIFGCFLAECSHTPPSQRSVKAKNLSLKFLKLRCQLKNLHFAKKLLNKFVSRAP